MLKSRHLQNIGSTCYWTACLNVYAHAARFRVSTTMRPQTAWSMLSKLMLADTTHGTITLAVTPGGDLILTPQDARLTVHSGPYAGSCFQDGTVLFKLGSVRAPFCDLPVHTLPLIVRYKNTTLYETDEDWAHAHADNLNAAAPAPVPLLHHAFKSRTRYTKPTEACGSCSAMCFRCR